MAESADGAATYAKPPPPRIGRLDSLSKCRLELARLYREARHGTLASQDACRLAHIIGLIGKMLEAADLVALEARIITLEQTIRSRP